MSGKDEQPNCDIPICPLCGERPKFWSLYPMAGGNTSRGWTWFYAIDESPFRDSRRLDHYYYSKLGDVRSIQCRRRQSGPFEGVRHIFEDDTAVFKEVLKQVKRFENERQR